MSKFDTQVETMARQAGLWSTHRGVEMAIGGLSELMAFAVLVAHAEREACAALARSKQLDRENGSFDTGFNSAVFKIEAAIHLRDDFPRCVACGYQHGHAIGCEHNPVDIGLHTVNARDKP